MNEVNVFATRPLGGPSSPWQHNVAKVDPTIRKIQSVLGFVPATRIRAARPRGVCPTQGTMLELVQSSPRGCVQSPGRTTCHSSVGNDHAAVQEAGSKEWKILPNG